MLLFEFEKEFFLLSTLPQLINHAYLNYNSKLGHNPGESGYKVQTSFS